MAFDTYTPATGLTPQGQQQAQQIASLQAQIAQGAPLNSAQDQGVQNLFQTYAQQQASNNTPAGRSTFLGATQAAPIQNNFDQLAQQLAGYDKAVLQPQFVGQNPGMPTDLPDNPYVTFGNLSYLTPQSSQLPAEQGIYNANPGYALTSSLNQGNSIANLLDTLNRAITTETKRGTGNYVGAMNFSSSALDNLTKLMGLSTDLKMKQMELANSRGNSSEYKLATLSEMLRSKAGPDGYVNPRTYADVKKQALDLGIDSATFDAAFADSYTNPNQDQLFPNDPYRFSDIYVKKGSLSSGANAKMEAMKKLGVNVVQGLDSIPDDVKNETGSALAADVTSKLNAHIGPLNIGVFTLTDKKEQDLADLEARYFALVQSALTTIQGSRPSDYDVKSYQQKLGPSIQNPPAVNAARIANLMNLMGIQGYPTTTTTNTNKGANDPLGIR